MRILVTNDDGINAEGIEVLTEIAKEISDDVWVVAPETEQSGSGHSLTMHLPLRIRKIDDKKFAVSGTPTDAVLLAVKEIVKNNKIDLVLSGINRGANLAEDVTYSGTIAAAMEATLLEIPAFALSQSFEDGGEINWQPAKELAPDLIKKLYKIGVAKRCLININFPDFPVEQVKGIKVTPQGDRKIGERLVKRTDPKGRDYYWIGGDRPEISNDFPGTDIHAIFSGYISVTPLYLDLTEYREMERIRENLEISK